MGFGKYPTLPPDKIIGNAHICIPLKVMDNPFADQLTCVANENMIDSTVDA